MKEKILHPYTTRLFAKRLQEISKHIQLATCHGFQSQVDELDKEVAEMSEALAELIE